MLNIILNAIKIAFLLGFLIFIHEAGHFLTAKFFNVKVKEFAIGFGPAIWTKQGKETKYQLRLIPLGGFVNLLGENEESNEDGSFGKAKIWKKILILFAGGGVNILFGLLIYFLIVLINTNFQYAVIDTINFMSAILQGIKELFTGNIGVEGLTGPVGISQIVFQTKDILNYIYIIAVISISLGVTNLLPFPPLDGGKIVLHLIEAVIRRPIKENINNAIQMTGFLLIMALAIAVTCNDVVRIF